MDRGSAGRGREEGKEERSRRRNAAHRIGLAETRAAGGYGGPQASAVQAGGAIPEVSTEGATNPNNKPQHKPTTQQDTPQWRGKWGRESDSGDKLIS